MKKYGIYILQILSKVFPKNDNNFTFIGIFWINLCAKIPKVFWTFSKTNLINELGRHVSRYTWVGSVWIEEGQQVLVVGEQMKTV